MKYLLRPIALSLLWLSVGLACKKEEPATQQYCDDGTCCNTSNEKFELAGRVEGVTAYFRDEVTISTQVRFPLNSDCATSVATVCELSLNKVKGVKPSLDFANPEYKYRVWGTVYYRLVQTYTCLRVLVINVDRIEEIK